MLRAGLWHRGMLRAVSAETPPPGQDWAIQVPTVPEGVWWEVKSIVAQLVTSATVANRSVRWLFASQFNPTLGERISAAYFAASSPGTLAAASSRIFSAYQGAPAVNSVSDSTGLPIDNRVQQIGRASCGGRV